MPCPERGRACARQTYKVTTPALPRAIPRFYFPMNVAGPSPRCVRPSPRRGGHRNGSSAWDRMRDVGVTAPSSAICPRQVFRPPISRRVKETWRTRCDGLQESKGTCQRLGKQAPGSGGTATYGRAREKDQRANVGKSRLAPSPSPAGTHDAAEASICHSFLWLMNKRRHQIGTKKVLDLERRTALLLRRSQKFIPGPLSVVLGPL